MRKTAFSVGFICLLLTQFGCGNGGQNRVIQGTGDEITPEMIEIEEAELETTQ